MCHQTSAIGIVGFCKVVIKFEHASRWWSFFLINGAGAQGWAGERIILHWHTAAVPLYNCQVAYIHTDAGRSKKCGRVPAVRGSKLATRSTSGAVGIGRGRARWSRGWACEDSRRGAAPGDVLAERHKRNSRAGNSTGRHKLREGGRVARHKSAGGQPLIRPRCRFTRRSATAEDERKTRGEGNNNVDATKPPDSG